PRACCRRKTTAAAGPRHRRTERLCLFNLSTRPRRAGRESSARLLASRERVRAGTGFAIENRRKWFFSQALSLHAEGTFRTKKYGVEGIHAAGRLGRGESGFLQLPCHGGESRQADALSRCRMTSR